jgi:hypothetical protein
MPDTTFDDTPDRPPDDGPPTEPLDGLPLGDDELLWPPDGYADLPVDQIPVPPEVFAAWCDGELPEWAAELAWTIHTANIVLTCRRPRPKLQEVVGYALN